MKKRELNLIIHDVTFLGDGARLGSLTGTLYGERGKTETVQITIDPSGWQLTGFDRNPITPRGT